jgi:lysosome membrane protein 2
VKEKHETFLEVEPMTGLVLNAARRIQINVQVNSHPDSSAVSTVNSMIMPLLWVEEAASADETSADKFKSVIQNKLVVGRAIMISGMAIGLAIFLVTLAIFIFHVTRRDQSHYVPAKADDVKKVAGSYSSLPQKEDFVSVIN